MSFIKSIVALAASTLLFSVSAANETEGVPESTLAETAVPADGQAVPAQPAESAPSDVNEEIVDQVASNDDKVICKYTVRPGSRLGSKVCMTKGEWDQIRKDSREGTDSMQRQNTSPGLPQG